MKRKKRRGYETRDKLRELILDKYGRLLAEIYIDDIHVNQWLINNNLAKPYEGGTKEKW